MVVPSSSTARMKVVARIGFQSVPAMPSVPGATCAFVVGRAARSSDEPGLRERHVRTRHTQPRCVCLVPRPFALLMQASRFDSCGADSWDGVDANGPSCASMRVYCVCVVFWLLSFGCLRPGLDAGPAPLGVGVGSDACKVALTAFERGVLENRSCRVDSDCVGVDIRPAAGCCCYGVSRSWVESGQSVVLSSRLCGRVTKICVRKCSAACVGGVCRAAALTNQSLQCGETPGGGREHALRDDEWEQYFADGGR